MRAFIGTIGFYSQTCRLESGQVLVKVVARSRRVRAIYGKKYASRRGSGTKTYFIDTPIIMLPGFERGPHSQSREIRE